MAQAASRAAREAQLSSTTAPTSRGTHIGESGEHCWTYNFVDHLPRWFENSMNVLHYSSGPIPFTFTLTIHSFYWGIQIVHRCHTPIYLYGIVNPVNLAL